MIPVSFAPMILKLVMPKIMDHFMEVFKLDQVLRYVEQPNDADIKIKSLEEQNKLLASEVGMLDNRLNQLEI